MKALYLLMAWLPALSVSANTILPLEQGLTLAEIRHQGVTQTIAVLEDNGENIKGINLGSLFNRALSTRSLSPIELYNALGYDKIVQHLTTASKENIKDYPYQQLLSPAGTHSLHYAVGLNYAEHAAEVNQQDKPFTFLKAVKATREEAVSYAPNRLLDYEVEICARPLNSISQALNTTTQPLNSITQPKMKEASFGYFLCGDFTDRARLLNELDLNNLQSGKGFSNAKSSPTYFPTGPYMVIPKNNRQFLADLELSLWLNGQLRQQSNTRHMIWSTERIIEDIFLAQKTGRDTYSENEPDWLPNGQLEPSASILTGTPEGVIMKAPSLWYKIQHGLKYVITGAFLTSDVSIKKYVVNAYIEDLFKEGHFLQEGDQLTLKADWLGTINLTVE
ncbi:fumarylacetoacetate hydrolase family protein [Litoribrevibacter albus]|uniref:Fumarylacetoacetase-like C-terminal domain-containing protein n=1 Tax=Litoribrevibacter albus TaxID=1473156 RepID=A0AA37W668_9GAMM|nr:fumarylacetoacetate hydrolase family protein [Litoribrevibacter albus]GLQ31345.1 hypothetical protein GCM10007876_18240 [Litoribrevibacter albus]